MVLTDNFCQQIKNICDSNFIHTHELRTYPLAFSKRCLDVSLKKATKPINPCHLIITSEWDRRVILQSLLAKLLIHIAVKPNRHSSILLI
jgi:hypothetical protein